ncbi:hypothetical protein N9888_00670 [Akkermansiaceae bacterium]|nr:hypothetical protein [Akkermansiaceae bacterium]
MQASQSVESRACDDVSHLRRRGGEAERRRGGEAGTVDSTIGWVCFTLAIIQYLIIALITSADKAGDLIGSFDRAVAEHREDLV